MLRFTFLITLASAVCGSAPVCAEVPQQGRWHSRVPIQNLLTTVNWFLKCGAEFGCGIDPSMTIGVDGLPIIAYRKHTVVTDQAARGDLQVIHCGNVECSSGNLITTLDSDSGFFSSIVVGSEGLPLVAYIGEEDALIPQSLRVAKCGNSECSSGNTIVILDPTATSAPAITVGTDGLPVIAYGAQPPSFNNPILRIALCEDSGCSSIDTLIGVPAVRAEATSIAIGADGAPIVATHDLLRGELKVVKCANARCRGDPVVTTIDDGNVGAYNSMTIGNDGLPLISYHDNGNDDLKVVHCGNPTCAEQNTISVVDEDSSGSTSISIGADGLPIVSHIAGDQLETVKCGNAFCSLLDAAQTVFALDQTGVLEGEHTSIAIGSDGLPIVAYAGCFRLPISMDTPATDRSCDLRSKASVRVAHCGSDRCLPYWIRH